MSTTDDTGAVPEGTAPDPAGPGSPRDPTDGDERLAAAGERIAEAKQAADEVAEQEHLVDEDRAAAAEAAGAGRPAGDGAEIAPG